MQELARAIARGTSLWPPDHLHRPGLGEGKACFYAALRFEQVIGIEFSQELVAAAEENLRRSGRRNIRYICADASQYELPHAPSLVFLFNPFDAELLEQFVVRNRDASSPRAA